jgi:hypothetical protein
MFFYENLAGWKMSVYPPPVSKAMKLNQCNQMREGKWTWANNVWGNGRGKYLKY